MNDSASPSARTSADASAGGSDSAPPSPRDDLATARGRRTPLSLPHLIQAAAALLWILQAGLLAWAVQRLAQGGGLRDVLWPACAVVAMGLQRALLDAWATQRLYQRSRQQLSTLRQETAAALARRSPLDRDRPASGLAASVLAEQAEAVVPWLSRYRSAQTKVMLVTPVIGLAVLSLSWLAALILLVALPLIPAFMALIGWRAKAASEAQMVELGQMNAFLLDRLRGLSTLRSLAAIDTTAQRVRATAESLRERTMRVLRIAFLSSASLELFCALAVALVAVFIGFHLLGPLRGTGTWSGPLNLGQGLFILMLAPAFFEPLRELAAVWHDKAAGQAALKLLEAHRGAGVPLPGAMAGSDALSDLGATSAVAVEAGVTASTGSRTGANADADTDTDADIESSTRAQPASLLLTAPSIVVRGLRFQHHGGATVFDGLTLHLRPGEHIALTGPSGSGKSTLLALLAGLLPADAGEIEIDGVHLTPDTAAALRGRIAWIGQQPHVFAGTVRRNVSLDRDGVHRAQVTQALAVADLADVAHAGLDHTLGERGTGLSGGELVRLALARAAAQPSAALLLADEPTAHLDPDTATRVIDALLRLAQGRTLIVATHDPVLIARLGRSIDLSRRPAPTRPVVIATARSLA